MTRSKNFADFLVVVMNDEKNFRNFCRNFVRLILKNAFLFYFFTSVSFNS